MTAEQISHLEMIQAVVARMSSNGLALKSLAVTLAAAVVALSAAQTIISGPSGSPTTHVSELPLIGIVPVLIIWLLDAYYVRIERAYRTLFDAIRGGSKVEPFLMDYRPYKRAADNVFLVAISSWVMAVYPGLVALLLAARFVPT